MHATPSRLARLAARLPKGRPVPPIVDGRPPAFPPVIVEPTPWAVLDDTGAVVQSFTGLDAHLCALREQDRRQAVTARRHTIASA